MRTFRLVLAALLMAGFVLPDVPAVQALGPQAPPAQAGSHTVTVNTIDDQWDWGNPNAASTKCSLREALQLLGTPATNLGCGTAPATATVFNINFFASGTYVLTYDDDLPHIGGGKTVNIDEWSLYIDGGMSGSLTDRHRGIFRVVGGTLNLKQITLQNGSRPGGGGAIELVSGTLTADRVTFKGNQAVLDGGALVVGGGAVVTVTNSIFEDNVALGRGGAVFTPFGYFYKTKFIGNRASGGGAVHIDDVASPVIFEECEFKENQAKPTPFNAPVSGYETRYDINGGGAIQVGGGGYVRLYRTVVKDNNSELTKGGAGLSNDGGTAVIEESVFTNNRASATGSGDSNSFIDYAWGGAIYNFGQTDLIRSSIHGNQADMAGGIMNHGGQVQLFNTTVTGNNAVSRHGGLVNEHEDFDPTSYPGTVRLWHATIGKNTAGSADPQDNLLYTIEDYSVYFSNSILDTGCNQIQYTHGNSLMTGVCDTIPDPQDPGAGADPDLDQVDPAQLGLQPLSGGDIPVPEFMVQEIDGNSLAVDAGRQGDPGCDHPLIDRLDANLATRGALCDSGAIEAAEAPPHFESTPPPGLVQFPVVRFDLSQTSTTVDLSIRNTGGGAMDYEVVDEGGSLYHHFVVNESPPAGTLYKNGEAILRFRCQPTEVGDHWKIVSIHTNAENHGGSYKFRCTGAGVDPLASTSEMPGPLNMPMGPPAMPLHQSVAVSNNGQMPLNANYMWQNPGPMWGVMPMGPMAEGGLPEAPTVIIPPGQTLTLDLSCTPPTPGVFLNTFRITSNDPGSPTIDFHVACHGFLPTPPEAIQGGNFFQSAGPTPIHGVAVSPDGAFVLAGHYTNNVLRVYSRDPLSGNLSPYTPYDSVSSPGMTQIMGIAYSRDNQNVYYTSQAGDGVVRLDRNGGILSVGEVLTRSTTYLCSINPFQFCPYNTMDGARGVAVSPDDKNVYVTGYNDGSLTVFNRNLTSGDLSLSQRITATVTGPNVLAGATRVIVSPDGEHVYVASYASDTVSAFRRDSSGRLSLLAVYRHNTGGLTSLDAPADLALSPDGEYLYVAAYGGTGALNIFRRSSGDGGLALLQTLPGNNPHGLAVSTDDYGERLFVARYLSDTVQAYGRDPATGALSLINGVSDTLFTSLNGPRYLAVSPDDQHVYVSLDDDTGVRQILTVRHAPVMGAISPAAAVEGSSALSLTVNGARFYPNSTVQYGAFPLSTAFVNETQLLATIPAGFLTGPFTNVSVVVSTTTPGGGQSAAAAFTVTPAGQPLAPSIESLEPPAIAFNGEDVVLVVHGANFLPAVQVTFNGVPVPTVYLNGETLQVTLPAALLTDPGTGGLAVTNLGPGAAAGLVEDAAATTDTTSAVVGFRVARSGTPVQPAITRLEPASVLSGTTGVVSGTTGVWVTVTGHNFVDGTQGRSVARFEGQERTTVVLSATELKVRLRPEDTRLAGLFDLTVFTDGAGESAPAEFRVRLPGEKPVPVLRAAGADPSGVLYLFGSDFDPGAQVHLNGSPRTALSVSSTAITLALGPDDWSGVATVTNPGPGGGVSNTLVYVNWRTFLPVVRR